MTSLTSRKAWSNTATCYSYRYLDKTCEGSFWAIIRSNKDNSKKKQLIRNLIEMGIDGSTPIGSDLAVQAILFLVNIEEIIQKCSSVPYGRNII